MNVKTALGWNDCVGFKTFCSVVLGFIYNSNSKTDSKKLSFGLIGTQNMDPCFGEDPSYLVNGRVRLCGARE